MMLLLDQEENGRAEHVVVDNPRNVVAELVNADAWHRILAGGGTHC